MVGLGLRLVGKSGAVFLHVLYFRATMSMDKQWNIPSLNVHFREDEKIREIVLPMDHVSFYFS